MGIDLGTATELLGRTLDGTAGRLNETVPALRNVSAEALKAGAAIEVVGKAFEGAAANKVKTFEGAMLQLSNTFGNFKAAMGDAITQNPMFIQAINSLSQLFSELTGKIGDNKLAINAWVTQGLLGVISSIRNLIPYLNEFMSWLKSIYAIIVILKDGFMNFINTITLLRSGLGMLIEKMTGLTTYTKIFNGALDDMDKRAEEMKAALADIGKDAFSKSDLKAADKFFKSIQDAANRNPIEIKANLTTDDAKTAALLGIKQMKDAMQKLKEDAAKEFDYPDEGRIKDPANYKDPAANPTGLSPSQLDQSNSFEVEISKFIDGITYWFKDFGMIASNVFKDFEEQFAKAIGSVSPIIGKSLGEIVDVIDTVGFAAYEIGNQIYDEVSAKSAEIGAAWTKGGGWSDPITSGLKSFGMAIDSVNWTDVAVKATDAMSYIGEKAVNFAKNMSMGAVSAGVAVAGTAVTSTVANIGKGKEGVMPAIVDTMGAIGTAFDSVLGTGNMIGDMIKSFLNMLGDPETLKGMINGFIDAIPTIIDSIIAAIPTMMDGIVRALPVLLDGIIKLIPVLFEAIAKGIGPILITLADAIPDIIIAIAENLGPIVEAIADALPTIITKLIAAIPRVATALVKAFLGIIWTLISKAIPNIIEGFTTGISKMLSNIGSGLKSGVSTKSVMGKLKAKPGFEEFKNKIDMSGFQKKLIDGATKLGKTFYVEIPKKILAAVKKLGQTFYVDIPKKIFAALKKLFQIFYVDIPMKIWDAIKKLGTFFYVTIPMKLWEAVSSLVTWFYNLGMQIWNQGVMPLVTWFAGLFQSIWDQGILPLVNWFAGLFQSIWDQGILPLVNWFAGLFQAIWDQGILPLVNWFAGLFQSIWDQGILPLVNWFSSLFQAIWDQGILPLVNWFANLFVEIWNQGVLPLVNFFLNLGSEIWNNGVLPLVNWFAELPGKLWDAIQDGFKGLSGGGGGKGGLFGGKVIPGVLATGGVVPKGYPNDSYPALLTSGETVVPAENASNLFAAIDALSKGNTSNASSAETNALLRQLIALIAGQSTTVNVQLDRNVLAKAILSLNQDNRRIA
jgi:hypothetical protein